MVLGACASNPNEIQPAYVPSSKYAQYDCEQLEAEAYEVQRRTTALYHDLKREANADNWQMGVGLVLFWPALLALEGGDDARAAQYSQLMGEYEAIRKNAVHKKCPMAVPSPQTIMKG